MRNIKHKASSISTETCNQVKDKVQGNLEIKTSEDLEFDPKKDAEMLSLGVRPDGGPQIAAKKIKGRFKSDELDIGKYMAHGYSIQVGSSMKERK